MGKIEGFQLKEREKIYLRRAKELEEKINEAKKGQVLQVLLKQQKDLETEFWDVV